MDPPVSRAKRLLAALAGISLTAGVSVVGVATPANADTSCPYPYVCFYRTTADLQNGTPISRYQDLTSGWQYLRSQSIGSDWIVNSRHDDVAYLHFTDGETLCLVPRGAVGEPVLVVDRIRIDTASECYNGQP
jgi:hypothetical protein